MQGTAQVRPKDSVFMSHRMNPVYRKSMSDPTTQAELLNILSDQGS